MTDSPASHELRLAQTLKGLHDSGLSIEAIVEMSKKSDVEVERLIILANNNKKKH